MTESETAVHPISGYRPCDYERRIQGLTELAARPDEWIRLVTILMER